MLQKYIGFLTAIPDFSYFSKSLIFIDHQPPPLVIIIDDLGKTS